ncbi:fungal-specific transcription factor domain-containing protein [Pyrenochaeta sp. MPI-SDFR-AT-0127]|nr:fungal-specific transcription factor domain-containing protein [Pyrenochaeta sp. MPI-SDFR-AT-0127]
MSSIKQVQDLQSQIAELTQMNTQLRTKTSEYEPLDNDRTEMKRRHSETLAGTVAVPHRVSVPVMNSFEHVRKNIREYSRGVFSTPHQYQSIPIEPVPGLPEVPLRADYAQLSRYYLDSVHAWYPVVHWPTFQHEVDEVYTSRSFEGASHEWIGLFFAVLACGSLQAVNTPHSPPNTAPKGQAFADIATQALTPWSHEFTIRHAQAAFLMSVFAAESNKRSLGSMWLASAARIAQELQISPEVDCWSAVDGEVRRRLWWAIYVRDRTVSLETNRSMIIHEDDCEMSLPAPVEDRYIQPQGFFRSQANAEPFTGFVATIHTTRLYAELFQALKSSVILPHVVQAFEGQFRMKQSLLPDSYQLDSIASLEAAALPTIITLLSGRFYLYRRNITPVCRPAERSDALGRCTVIAQETAKYISRILHNPPKSESEKSWHARVTPIASNMVCLHLWRSVLVLCFSGDYDAALMCLHLMTAIGTTRQINAACGRNIVFFLEHLGERVRSGRGSLQQLEHDEEMMAYVSGDAQGSLEHSWVWAGMDLSSSKSPQVSPRTVTRPQSFDEPMRDALPLRVASSSPEHSSTDWDDWGRIEHMIRQLIKEHRPRTAQPPTYYPPPHNPLKRVQLAPEIRSPPKPAPTASPAQSSTSRISIANII